MSPSVSPFVAMSKIKSQKLSVQVTARAVELVPIAVNPWDVVPRIAGCAPKVDGLTLNEYTEPVSEVTVQTMGLGSGLGKHGGVVFSVCGAMYDKRAEDLETGALPRSDGGTCRDHPIFKDKRRDTEIRSRRNRILAGEKCPRRNRQAHTTQIEIAGHAPQRRAE